MNDRYLVQFLRCERDPRGYWVTDCAFQEGQLDRAITYVNTVLRSPSTKTASALIIDRGDDIPGRVIYRAEMFPIMVPREEPRLQPRASLGADAPADAPADFYTRAMDYSGER